jgi:hypothetical protein
MSKPPSSPTPATSSSPCSAPSPPPPPPSSASTSWPAALKKPSKTGSTPRESGDSLEQIVLYYLGLRQATLAVAESCTGGMIAQRITSVPGSSRSFLGGAVVYSDRSRPPSPASPRAHRPARRSLRRSSQALATGIRSAPAQPSASASPASPAPPAPPTSFAAVQARRPRLHRLITRSWSPNASHDPIDFPPRPAITLPMCPARSCGFAINALNASEVYDTCTI